MALPHPEAEWRAHLAQGRFMLQRSPETGRYIFFPRVAASATGTEDLEWVEASGEGTIYAVTIVRRRAPDPDYNVVLVDLKEGPRLMSRMVERANEDIKIGDTVRARIDAADGQTILVFAPA